MKLTPEADMFRGDGKIRGDKGMGKMTILDIKYRFVDAKLSSD